MNSAKQLWRLETTEQVQSKNFYLYRIEMESLWNTLRHKIRLEVDRKTIKSNSLNCSEGIFYTTYSIAIQTRANRCSVISITVPKYNILGWPPELTEATKVPKEDFLRYFDRYRQAIEHYGLSALVEAIKSQAPEQLVIYSCLLLSFLNH